MALTQLLFLMASRKVVRSASITLVPEYAGLPPHHAAYARESPNRNRATLEGEFTSIKADVARAGFNTDDYSVMFISATIMPEDQSVPNFLVILNDSRDSARTDRTSISVPADDPDEPGTVAYLLSKVCEENGGDYYTLAHIQVTFMKPPV